MNCLICRTGTTAAGAVTVTLERNDSVVVNKDVPAQVCDDCGEYYLDEAVTKRVCALADTCARYPSF